MLRHNRRRNNVKFILLVIKKIIHVHDIKLILLVIANAVFLKRYSQIGEISVSERSNQYFNLFGKNRLSLVTDAYL